MEHRCSIFVKICPTIAAVDLSPTARRTRRDLVDAAIDCWSEDSGASLTAVAQAAGTARTTLNRYFASRAELVAAVDAECRDRFASAAARARPEEGTGLAVLQRLCAELIGLGPVLGLIFADNALVDPDRWDTSEPGSDFSAQADQQDSTGIGSVVLRAQADGSVDPELPAEWVATTVWTTLFAAWLCIRGGSATTHEAALLCGRTLARGVGGEPGLSAAGR
jgi:AcrR family transcriptional regulator